MTNVAFCLKFNTFLKRVKFTKKDEKMPATPKVWITSDFHFFHENVMIYSDRYSDEFHNINDYQNALMSHLASFVKKDDIFLFLGDIALSKDKSVQGCKDLSW